MANLLKDRAPEIWAELHPDKNPGIDLLSLSFGSNKKVCWRCAKGHEWITTVANRTYNKTKCPECPVEIKYEESLEFKHPDLVKTSWDFEKNGDIKPSMLKPKAHYSAHWKCDKGHSWQAVVYSRTDGRDVGCPYCTGRKVCSDNSLQTLFPEIAKQWHPTKNGSLTPNDVTMASNKKVFWCCEKGHEWEVAICDRVLYKTGCPYCSNKRIYEGNSIVTTHPHILKEWNYEKNEGLSPSEVSFGCPKLIHWVCQVCNKEWEASLDNRIGKGSGCPGCAWKTTGIEIKFSEIIKGFVDNHEKFDKKVLESNRCRPDFKLTETLYANVDGLWWHCEENREDSYHLKIREAFEEEGLTLLQFYEDEIDSKLNIVKSMVLSRLGKIENKIYARDCKVVEPRSTDSSAFFEANHLMGPSKARTIGLEHEGRLVSAMSYYVKPNSGHVEISRFASILDTSVIGGFSKLLSHLIDIARNSGVNKIISFCDLRYAKGSSYEKLGFIREKVTQGWCWTDGSKRYNRLQCQAGNGKSENENAAEKKWFRLYDAGQAKYALSI